MPSMPITYKKPSNPCVRCGSERIVARQWKEKQKTLAGTTEILFFQTICPNPTCQALVDKALREETPKTKKPLTFAPKELQRNDKKSKIKIQKKVKTNKKKVRKNKKVLKKKTKKTRKLKKR